MRCHLYDKEFGRFVLGGRSGNVEDTGAGPCERWPSKFSETE